MHFSPFKFEYENIFESTKLPFTRMVRTSFGQKIKDSFFVINGTFDSIGVLDWLTLGIPKITMYATLFLLILPLIFYKLSKEDASLLQKGLAFLGFIVSSIVAIPAFFLLVPLVALWFTTVVILTLLSLPLVGMVHLILHKDLTDTFEHIIFDKATDEETTLATFLKNNPHLQETSTLSLITKDESGGLPLSLSAKEEIKEKLQEEELGRSSNEDYHYEDIKKPAVETTTHFYTLRFKFFEGAKPIDKDIPITTDNLYILQDCIKANVGHLTQHLSDKQIEECLSGNLPKL